MTAPETPARIRVLSVDDHPVFRDGISAIIQIAIRAVHAGRRHLPPEIAQEIALHAVYEPLCEREIEVLRCVGVGQANKEIARKLGVSEETVKAHLKSIFTKLDVKDRTQAVTLAVKRGVIDL